jgi:hypothetical protein
MFVSVTGSEMRHQQCYAGNVMPPMFTNWPQPPETEIKSGFADQRTGKIKA